MTGWETLSDAIATDSDQFGGAYLNRITQLLIGADIAASDATLAPIIGTNWTFKSGKLFLNDVAGTHTVNLIPDTQSVNTVIKTPAQSFTPDYISLRKQAEELENKVIDFTKNTFVNIPTITGGILTGQTIDALTNTIKNIGFANYIVSFDGTNYNARNNITGLITSNALFSSLMSTLNTALGSAGGTIFFMSPNFDIDAPIAMSNPINLVGNGRKRSVLKRITTNTTTSTIALSGSNYTIRDLTIDGNYPTNTTSLFNDLGISGNNVLITNVDFINFNSIALALTGTGANNIVSNCVINGVNVSGKSTFGIWCATGSRTISKCNIQNCSLNAIFAGGITTVEDSYFANNAIAGGGQVAGANNAVTTTYKNCVFDPGLVLDSGIEMSYGDWIVDGNKITGQHHWGIVQDLGLNSAIVTNNVIKNCSQSAANTYSGIEILSPVSYFKISGNICYDDQGTHTQAYGIRITAIAVDNYIIRDNICFNNVSGQLLDLGTGTNKRVTDNITSDPLKYPSSQNLQSLYHIRESGLASINLSTMGLAGLFIGSSTSIPASSTFVTDSNGRYVTKSAATGNTMGVYISGYVTIRALNPRLRASMGFGTLAANADARMYFGLCTSATNSTTDTPMATTDSGVLIGARTTDTNFQVFNNDGTGAIVVTDTGVPKSASGLMHFEIVATDSIPNFKIYINGVLKVILTTRIPSSTAQLLAEGWVVPASATAITSNWGFMQIEHGSTQTANWATGLVYNG